MTNQKAVDDILDCVREAFDKMDTDNNGAVTFSEFKAFCEQIEGMTEIPQAFVEYDDSGDNKVTLQELNDFITGKAAKNNIEDVHVRRLFKRADKSGDGKLDRAEFRALLVDCGYNDTIIENTIEHCVDEQGMITLQDFLDKWEHDQ